MRSPSGSLNPFATAANPNGTIYSLEPGSMVMLPAECEVTFSTPTDHRIAFRSIHPARGASDRGGHESAVSKSVSGDLSMSVTFASGRAGILEFRRQCEQIQYATLIPLFAQPILDRWLKIAAALGYADAEIERPPRCERVRRRKHSTRAPRR